MENELPLICLVGATGTGKTAAALALARAFGGGVINFDSRQVYAGLGIVTAQPTAEEQSVCPHALYGYLPVSESVRAGAFAGEILEQARTYAARGLLPILVGGTGLYLKSLIDGLAPIPDINSEIRAEVVRTCQEIGSPALHARLSGFDPEYASRIHPNDPQRICRAVEVYTATGRTLTWWHGHTCPPEGLRAVQIGLDTDLEMLTPRLALRIELMLEHGALEEMRAAYAACPDRQAPGFSGIGCPELLAMQLDGLSREEAVVLWLRNTRAYAKRQLTWFRKDQRIQWFAPADVDGMLQCAGSFLGRN